jgi:hypothetical protein
MQQLASVYPPLYIHTTPDYRQLQLYCYSTHFPVHRYTCTRSLNLHCLYPGNGFISLSVTSNHTQSLLCTVLIHFLPFFRSGQLRRLDLIHLLLSSYADWPVSQTRLSTLLLHFASPKQPSLSLYNPTKNTVF